ncbi:MAG: arginine--tRNA ligase [Actinomycetes bacterium]
MSLTTDLIAALQSGFDAFEPGADPILASSDHGDYQANGVLPLAKRLGRKPRELADELVAGLDLKGLASLEVSGPGFLNLVVSPEALSASIQTMVESPTLGVTASSRPRKVVVDYSAPNVAKEMHVGHLRSTVIGDAICRMLEFSGHEVIRRNHLGDWGTPFGMLIEHLLDLGEEAATEELSVGDLDGFYRAARGQFDASEAFQERSRARVVLLQSGDQETLRLWSLLVATSVRYFATVYDKLDVLLRPDDVAGESSYNDLLDAVVADLDTAGLLVDSDGARCVFPEGFANREGEALPLIVQKSDGGYGYAATDLAAIRNRVADLHADEILYVVGAPQAQHFAMCFAVAKMAGWLPEETRAVHVAFGSVLGPDRKVFRTREGGTVKLVDLLEEGERRALAAMADRSLDHGNQTQIVAASVGIGAVKWADLSTDRVKDYVFDWDRMLTFEGDTGPYLQYAHARICSLIARAADQGSHPATSVSIVEPAERALAFALTGFGDALEGALESYSPSKLAHYLFDLAQRFTSFYESCPVLRADDESIRASRLALAELTARNLRCGLGLLGIGAPERM